MRSRLAALLVALGLAVALAAGAAPAAGREAWAPADPEHRWSFPRDHHAHPGHRNEWWYFTGLLAREDEPSARFGYQVTFFRVGLVPDPPDLDSAWATGTAVMAHLAVTDLRAGTHVFSEVLWRAVSPLGGFGAPGDPLLAFARAPPGTDGTWTLSLRPDGAFALEARDAAREVAIALVLRPEKPVVLQGPNGYSRKAAADGYASLYYSFTRLATDGMITLGESRSRVRGTSWMDKEFGSSQLGPGQVGWDWWSLRLADGRDLMLYVLRRADGSPDWRNGTLVEADGTPRLLGPDDWAVEPRGRWKSPETGAVYPSGWRIRVPAARIDVVVEPEVESSENVSRLLPELRYWEGPVRVVGPSGERVGEGYVELTGYGAGARLPL